MANVVEVLVPGGKATPGPPLGPALGPLGINIKKVVDDINEVTKDFNGMQVPVKIIVDEHKKVTIEVGTPPTSALILKEIGLEKGAKETGTEVVGNLTIDQVVSIARRKKDKSLSYSLKNVAKEIIGTCVSMGITVEGMSPKEMQQAITEGKYNEVFESV